MKRIICISIIALILFSFAIFEIIQVSTITKYMDTQVADLPKMYEENKDDITVLSNKIQNISNYWNSYEDGLCLIFSHKDLSTTTDSITKLLAYTKNNDYDNAIAEITLLSEITQKNHHIMGFNIHNVL